eukprot:g9214.t1
MSAEFDIDGHLLSNSKSLLREDDSLLRQIFFNLFKRHHPKLANKVDVIYGLSKSWCDDGCLEDFELLAKSIRKLEASDRVIVASCFSHTLNLHNLTEALSGSLEILGVNLDEMGYPLRRTTKSIKNLEKEEGFSPNDIFHTLSNQSVELVFTAHPTQALRREIVSSYRKMQNVLAQLHSTKMGVYEREECLEQLQGLIQTAWRTDEIHRSQPTPQDEMRAGIASFIDVIFPTLPNFLRRLDSSLMSIGQPRIPLDHALFKFGSWMGGDRDGNPNVTHDTTRDVCILSRLTACDLYFKEIEKLLFEISLWRVDDHLEKKVDAILEKVDHASEVAERKRRNYADFWIPIPKWEPFRVILSNLRDKLYRTREVLHKCLPYPTINVKDALEQEECIRDLKDLTNPLLLIYRSLTNTGDEFVANGHLLDLIRQVYAFGLSIVRLDIRQEASRHTEVMNCITEYLELGSYIEWDEETRLDFLVKELSGRRPLLPPGMPMSSNVEEVVKTFRVLSSLPCDSLGAYVISMAKSASDVLAVMLLQRECGIKTFLRVVPLFETLTDLDNAPSIMHRLFSNEWYHATIDGKQECMIGYSDSGKDAGRLAAAWALYQVQLKLVSIAEEFRVRLSLFHGRGGTVGRGGGPAHIAIKSQPPGTIKGTMRVTIQGEIIAREFGEKEVCCRTLDLYTSAVLDATMSKIHSKPQEEWKQLLSQMAQESCKSYRSIVFQDHEFINYFRQITPVVELGKLNIGSRPASRKKSGGVETLRAIPWIFAWNQTRFLLPVWLGIGEAIKAAFDSGKKDILVKMYKSWTFFQVTIDLVEMVLFKADPRVVKMYDAQLVDPSLKRLGEDLTNRFLETKKLIAEVTGHGSLGLAAKSANPLLYHKIKLRAPYVTPLNMLQIECLKDLRSLDNEDPNETIGEDTYQDIEDALLITIKGIAAGMQNTG